jgi:hypothetical protein
MSRQKETAIRSSLGATPATIFEQLPTKNLVPAFLGSALGLASAIPCYKACLP